MDRFIIQSEAPQIQPSDLFTFQYGQIYYEMDTYAHRKNKTIYIPIWLDLLLLQTSQTTQQEPHLHSNMVRFIIVYKLMEDTKMSKFTFQYGQIYYNNKRILNEFVRRIYIPIWLDLL